jgi:hypothetical protein
MRHLRIMTLYRELDQVGRERERQSLSPLSGKDQIGRMIRGAMAKKYFVDVYTYICPTCNKQSLEKAYFAIFAKAEIGTARSAGLYNYKCSNCGAIHRSDRVLVNGESNEVSKEEALANGLVFESKGSA